MNNDLTAGTCQNVSIEAIFSVLINLNKWTQAQIENPFNDKTHISWVSVNQIPLMIKCT